MMEKIEKLTFIEVVFVVKGFLYYVCASINIF